RAGRALDAFTVRKEPKEHGTGRLIEGSFAADTAVVVVEDVLTTGESARRAIQVVTDAGARVLGVLAVVDREEGARAALESGGHLVRALFTAAELVGDGCRYGGVVAPGHVRSDTVDASRVSSSCAAISRAS